MNAATRGNWSIPFFDACLKLRLPSAEDKMQTLRPIDLKSSWLATLLSDTALPAGKFEGKAEESVWLPNERFANTWSEYVKTGATSDTQPAAPPDLASPQSGWRIEK